MVTPLEDLFPGLRGSGYQITSRADRRYNCIAWAAGDSLGWWWPDAAGAEYWPASAPRDETVAAFQQMFESLGYIVTSSDGLEAGFDKIAIFALSSGAPTHASRQLANGRWTSKIGERDDIEHGLRDLEGMEYGVVALVMKRPSANDAGIS